MLLSNHNVMRTCSIEAIRKELARIYTKPILQTAGKNEKLNASINSCQLKDISIGYCVYGAAVHMEFPAADWFVQMMRCRGGGVVMSGSTSVWLVESCGALISPDRGYSADYDADCERLILQIDAAALTAKLAALTGEAINVPLRMEPRADFARPITQIFRTYLRLLVDTLNAAETPLPNWWIEQTEQFLMVMFLFAHRHNYSHLLPQGPSDASLLQVRRAEEYIEANAGRTVSLEELAETCGASGLSLFRAFRRVRGYSPFEPASRQRLKRQE